MNSQKRPTSKYPPKGSISVSELGAYASHCEVQALLRYRDGVAKSSVTEESKAGDRIHAQMAAQAVRYESARRSGSYQGPRDSRCYIATAVFGASAPETERLREWRDEVLMPTAAGRCLVACYYWLSPKLLILARPNSIMERGVRTLLRGFVARLAPRSEKEV
jgi:hypothetical protein